MSRPAPNISEECYISALPRPPDTPEADVTRDAAPALGRRKRFRGSSSDEDESEGDIHNNDFRAGGPFLAMLPATSLTIPHDNPVLWAWSDSIRDKLVQILDCHNVSWTDVTLIDRISDNEPHDGPTETVVVSAKKTQADKSWLRACFDMLECLQAANLGTMNVEIIDDRADRPMFTTAIPPEHPIRSQWPELATRVCNILGTKQLVAVECFRRGVDINTEKNSPTVLITIPPSSQDEYKPVRDEVSALLDAQGLTDVAAVLYELEASVFHS